MTEIRCAEAGDGGRLSTQEHKEAVFSRPSLRLTGLSRPGILK